jgi:hypothetical protein
LVELILYPQQVLAQDILTLDRHRVTIFGFVQSGFTLPHREALTIFMPAGIVTSGNIPGKELLLTFLYGLTESPRFTRRRKELWNSGFPKSRRG